MYCITYLNSYHLIISRLFANVGSGLFCVERVYGKTFIYDCGGETKTRVNNVITDVIDSSEVVDILFISHFHRDHINGIQYLLKNYDVRTVIFPLRKEYELFYINLLNYEQYLRSVSGMNNQNIETSLVLDTVNTIHMWSQKTKVIGVKEVESSDQDDNLYSESHGYEGDDIDINNLTDGLTIASGTRIVASINAEFDGQIETLRWILNAWNISTIEERYRKTMESKYLQFVHDSGLPHPTLIDVWNWFLNNKLYLIHKTTNNISKGNLNSVSMTLYTGLTNEKNKSGCLYTGDYDAKKNINLLKKAYSTEWDNVRIVQIPHHGSRENYSPDLINHLETIAVISDNYPSKEKNRRETLEKLQLDGITTLVTGVGEAVNHYYDIIDDEVSIDVYYNL